jgi:hypothetical protein
MDYNWNNPGYFYGYRMMRGLAEEHGDAKLREYLTRGGAAFFKDHLARLKAAGTSHGFSPRFIEVVTAIDAKAAACRAGTA